MPASAHPSTTKRAFLLIPFAVLLVLHPLLIHGPLLRPGPRLPPPKLAGRGTATPPRHPLSPLGRDRRLERWRTPLPLLPAPLLAPRRRPHAHLPHHPLPDHLHRHRAPRRRLHLPQTSQRVRKPERRPHRLHALRGEPLHALHSLRALCPRRTPSRRLAPPPSPGPPPPHPNDPPRRARHHPQHRNPASPPLANQRPRRRHRQLHRSPRRNPPRPHSNLRTGDNQVPRGFSLGSHTAAEEMGL